MAQTTQRLLFRYLKLNHRAKRSKEANEAEKPFPPLHELVDKIWTEFRTVGERHIPPLVAGQPQTGTRYIVPLRKTVHAKSKAVTIRFCVYTAGESPGFAPKDLDAAESHVSYQHVVDEKGEELAPGVEFSALFLGRVVLIQNRAGVSAARAVQRMVHSLGRKVCGPTFVLPQFMSVSPKSIAKQIKDAGGVIAVSFGVIQNLTQSGTTAHLDDIHKIEERLGGEHTRIRISAANEHTLDAEASVELFEEQEDEGLENVRLHLKNSETIAGRQMVLGKPATVPVVNGVPDCDAVDKELLSYLQELMRVDSEGEQSVTPSGLIGAKLKIVEFKVKK